MVAGKLGQRSKPAPPKPCMAPGPSMAPWGTVGHGRELHHKERQEYQFGVDQEQVPVVPGLGLRCGIRYRRATTQARQRCSEMEQGRSRAGRRGGSRQEGGEGSLGGEGEEDEGDEKVAHVDLHQG